MTIINLAQTRLLWHDRSNHPTSLKSQFTNFSISAARRHDGPVSPLRVPRVRAEPPLPHLRQPPRQEAGHAHGLRAVWEDAHLPEELRQSHAAAPRGEVVQVSLTGFFYAPWICY